MKRNRLILILSAVAVLSLAVSAYAAGAPVMTATGDMIWKDEASVPGVKYFGASGDHTKGAYKAFFKLPGGSTHPLHTHTSDLTCVVEAGTFMVGAEGGAEKEYGPGSYLFIPGGWKHTSSCKAGTDCVLYQESPGKFDMHPVTVAPAKDAGKGGKK